MNSQIRFWTISLTLALFLTLLLTSCKEITIPTVNTLEITNVNDTSAKCGGEITSDGGETVTARGVCWNTNQTPTIADKKTTNGTGVGSFISSITDLTPNTTYYVRAYATNSKGTGYGLTMIFTTKEEVDKNSFTDPRDGYVYKTVTIGNKVWMAENLRYLPSVVDPQMASNTTPYYYVYEYSGTSVNDAKATENYNTYGVLYNWTAACSSCPNGWHLPSDAEWTQLIDYFGGYGIAGGKLKETGTSHWYSPNTGATNDSNFTAIPGGYRFYDGSFRDLGRISNWWTATESNVDEAWNRDMRYNSTTVYRGSTNVKGLGFSVRCVKN